jgi:error-prone DNA polymerase
VRSIGDDLAARVAEGRPYRSMEDLRRRTGAGLPALEALATAGAFGSLGVRRREALWTAGAVAQAGPERLAGIVTGERPPPLPAMTEEDTALADLWATGVAADGHPTRFARARLDALGVTTAARLCDVADRARVRVAGIVTHRQRPATAQGIIFLNLEDETGLVNVVVHRGCWARHRRVAREAPALLVKDRLERGDGGVTNVVAERLEAFPMATATMRSRDFR